MVLVMWVNSFSQVPTSSLSQGRRGTHSPCHVWRWEKGGMANLDAGFHRNQLPHFLLWLQPKESIFPALPS